MVQRKAKPKTARATPAKLRKTRAQAVAVPAVSEAEAPKAVIPAVAVPPLLVTIEEPQPSEVRPRVSLDEGKRREVVAILSVGCSRTTAAQYVGCHAATITRTAMRDPEFARQIRQAESLLEIKHLKNIDAAAKDTRYWRAAAWALERKYPDRWAARRPHTITPEQVSQALQQFAQLVVDEVADAETRKRILQRLDEFAAGLSDEQTGAADDGN